MRMSGIRRMATNWLDKDFFIGCSPLWLRIVCGIPWGVGALLFKDFAEVEVVAIANQGGYLLQGIGTVLKERLGLVYPQFRQMLGEGLVQVFGE